MKFLRDRSYLPASHAGIIASVLFICVALVGLDGWRTWQARQITLSEDKNETANLARSLAQHAHDIVQTVDLTLLGLRERVDIDGRSPANLERLHRVMASRVDAMPFVSGLFLFDAEGRWQATSFPTLATDLSASDRDYFVYHRSHQDVGARIGPPIQSKHDGSWLFTVTRRIDDGEGRFAGVLVATISIDKLNKFYGAFDVGAAGVISLATSDGILIARQNAREPRIGTNLAKGQIFREFLPLSPVGSFQYTPASTPEQRLGSYRRVDDYPLVVVVAHGLDEVLADWRSDAITHLIVSLTLAAAVAFFGHRLARHIKSRQEADSLYRLLTEHASDMVCRVGWSGKGLYVSPASQRLFGISPQELIGYDATYLVHPEDKPALAALQAQLLSGAVEDGTLTCRVVRPDGRWVWTEIATRTLFDASTNAPDGYVAVLRDVTERRSAEEAGKASEARYRLLADSTSDVITCLDLEFRRTYASPSCRTVFGYEPDEMLGCKPVATMHPDDARSVYELVRPLLAGVADRAMVTYRAQHRQGHWVWIEATIGLVRNPATSDPESLVCALRDISERQAQAEELRSMNADLERLARHLARARDQAEQTSAAKSRFLAGMSHELRTPLNGILGYTHLLRLSRGLNVEQEAHLDAMLGAGQHLLEMINRVLDLSEVEAERVKLRPTDIDLHQVARACLDLMYPIAEAKGLSLSLNMAPSASRKLTTDLTHLRQILLNLLGNAVKFTAVGAVELRLGTSADGAGLRFEVVDTGPGIPAEHRHHLFQAFERLHAEATVAAEGAGLGLALSARLAATMGGRLGHEDNPQGGSVFWLELPLAADSVISDVACGPPINVAADKPGAQPALPLSRSVRVLVVDDVAMNREIAAAFLTAADHDVTCVQGGAEAAEAAEAGDFDVILMDVRMPEVDGLEATRRIRALPGPRGRVPIVALTAQAFTEQVRECHAAGMDDHLAKPFSPAALLAAVTKAIAARSAHNEVHTSAVEAASAPTLLGAVLGSELELLDVGVFDRTSALLTPEVIATCLQTIAGRGEALMRKLRSPSALSSDATDLSLEAHTLAGSAGMFGFQRLAATARHFEVVASKDAVALTALADSLARAIEASIELMPIRPLAVRSFREHAEA